MNPQKIKGFLSARKTTAGGRAFQGRFICHDVQWMGEGPEILATFTTTAEEIATAAESRVLWTDQDVQRGIKQTLDVRPPKELPLCDGYPNANYYIFDASNADDMCEKLLSGSRLFLNPLVWNARPGHFEAYWDNSQKDIYFYSGNIYLPDSHHRQQAILKAVRTWHDAPTSYPHFTPTRQFKVELYFLSKEDEGNFFYDKNQRPKPTAKSKAYDLTTLDDLSVLAKSVISKSIALRNNVNRVTDRLSPKNPQVITLSTLREMMRLYASSDALDQVELEGLSATAAQFYDLLASARTELGSLEPRERRKCREALIVDSAVMMHGYAALMKDYSEAIFKEGSRAALETFRRNLDRLSSKAVYKYGRWTGDLFDKRNPLWLHAGIVKPGKDGKRLTTLNTGAARTECGRILRAILAMSDESSDLRGLITR